MEDNHRDEVEAMCRECGHGFKAHMDRVLNEEKNGSLNKTFECPVCGCGDCKIGE